MLLWHGVETVLRTTLSLVGVYVPLATKERTVLKAALQVGLAQTVTSVVTAIMVPCVTLSVETVPVVWAGLAHAVTQNVPQADLVQTAS